MDFDALGSGVAKAVGYLLIAGLAALIYNIGAKGMELKGVDPDTSKRGLFFRLAKGLGVCLIIAFFATSMTGTSSDCSENDDPLRGSCQTTQEYEPNSEEKENTFAYFTTLTFLPFLLGAFSVRSNAIEAERKAALADWENAYLHSEEVVAEYREKRASKKPRKS